MGGVGGSVFPQLKALGGTKTQVRGQVSGVRVGFGEWRCSLPSETACGLITQHVLSVYFAVLQGP